MKTFVNGFRTLYEKNRTISSWILVAVSLCIAYLLCCLIAKFSWIDNDAPIIFLMAVVLVSRFTDKYRYGIVVSLAGTFAINYFFTYPYNFFTLMIAGYPIDFICMTIISIIISTITSQERDAARRALTHEQETIELYNENRKLEAKRAEARLEAEKEKMYSNLLRMIGCRHWKRELDQWLFVLAHTLTQNKTIHIVTCFSVQIEQTFRDFL